MTITDEPQTQFPDPPKVSGDDGGTGHLEELRTDPIGLMQRVRDECGDVGEFRLADKDVVLLTGAEANEVFFRAKDEDLDQAAAYPFMTPIFGEGVVFDATPEQRREQLHNMALRDKMMRGHAATIQHEVEEMVVAWDQAGAGEIDLLDWFSELTIYTSSTCLIGRKFRLQLDNRFGHLYHALEQGTDALAFVDAYADIPSFRARDEARVGLVALIQAIMDERRADTTPIEREDRDLLDVLMSIAGDDGDPRFDADMVTGMFISMMFAGHHTTSGTAAWTLIELLRHPEEMAKVVAELDELYADGAEVSYQALRSMPRLEGAIKEALRLHPPLILLLRVANIDLDVGGCHIPAGKMVGASPAISNRLPEAFDDPDAFRPGRYSEDPAADAANPWNWIPFGAGRHRCVGAQFAMMQLKAIFSVLLKDWTIEAAQPLDSYRNDHSKMVVQLAQPCLATYRRRDSGDGNARADGSSAEGTAIDAGGVDAVAERAQTRTDGWRIAVDRDLCQGHAVCEGEAPELFSVTTHGELTVLDQRPPEGARAAAEAAVTYCPTRALSIVDDPSINGPVPDATEPAGHLHVASNPMTRRPPEGTPLMAGYPRAEMDEMVERWLQVNKDAEATGDWEPMAQMYTEDATYGWNYGPKENFMAVGRDEIRSIALGLEMGGLGGWEYPYQEVVIDEAKGHVVGFWRQIADAVREDGTHYEVGGIGGSWFRYAGNFQWSWQRDWFDYGNAAAVFLEMITDGKLSEGMTERMNRSLKPGQLPGHYLLKDTPVGLWDGPTS